LETYQRDLQKRPTGTRINIKTNRNKYVYENIVPYRVLFMDLQKRPTKESNKRDRLALEKILYRQGFCLETYKRDQQKRPTEETYKRDLQKRPTKKAYKRDPQRGLLSLVYVCMHEYICTHLNITP